jgi:hypothetical protein
MIHVHNVCTEYKYRHDCKAYVSSVAIGKPFSFYQVLSGFKLHVCSSSALTMPAVFPHIRGVQNKGRNCFVTRTEAEFLDEIQTKVFLPVIHSHLYTHCRVYSLAWKFLFLLTLTVKEKGEKPDRKQNPFPMV